MSKIKIIINSGGCVQSVYTSRGLKKADVEIIDFCTDDPDYLDEAQEAWKKVERSAAKGTLVPIY